ncbi:conserved membrane protein of unknown function [Tenacibaculum sp. 190130A14a]|uniref:Uncharacterized protein n=1 Tax=Tenacibaculum polynesiense TaxID=3137857 RepID=A0ABP1F000_9FLAO
MKTTKIYTIILHSFIIIGVGHGIGIMAMFDIASIPNLISGYGFALNGSFSDKIMSIGLISLIGKLLLITSFFIKSENYKRVSEIIGVIMLWISVYFLTNGDWIYDSAHEIAFYTSIPFLISSIVFSVLLVIEI